MPLFIQFFQSYHRPFVSFSSLLEQKIRRSFIFMSGALSTLLNLFLSEKVQICHLPQIDWFFTQSCFRFRFKMEYYSWDYDWTQSIHENPDANGSYSNPAGTFLSFVPPGSHAGQPSLFTPILKWHFSEFLLLPCFEVSASHQAVFEFQCDLCCGWTFENYTWDISLFLAAPLTPSVRDMVLWLNCDRGMMQR